MRLFFWILLKALGLSPKKDCKSAGDYYLVSLTCYLYIPAMPPGMDLHGRGQGQRQGIPPPPPLINKPQRASPKPAKSPPASVGHAPMMGSITHGTAGSITQGTPVRTVTPGTPGSHQMSSVPPREMMHRQTTPPQARVPGGSITSGTPVNREGMMRGGEGPIARMPIPAGWDARMMYDPRVLEQMQRNQQQQQQQQYPYQSGAQYPGQYINLLPIV